MANEHRARIPATERARLSQTQYRVELAHRHLGIRPEDVGCFPFFRANLRRIARQLNQGRAKDETIAHPFAVLECSQDAEARRLWSAYNSVPASFRRLLRPECFCLAARVHPMRALELVTAAAVHQGAQASAILAAVSHPRVVEKTIQMALRDQGIADRNALHRATGFTPLPKGSTTIVNVQQNAQGQGPATYVLAPSPESTIRMLAEAFNEARQTQPAHPSPVRDTINVTAQLDRAYHDKDES